MRVIGQRRRPGLIGRAPTTKDGAKAQALAGSTRGYYTGVRLVFEGELSTEVEDYQNAFCSAATRGINKVWYTCGRYLVTTAYDVGSWIRHNFA